LADRYFYPLKLWSESGKPKNWYLKTGCPRGYHAFPFRFSTDGLRITHKEVREVPTAMMMDGPDYTLTMFCGRTQGEGVSDIVAATWKKPRFTPVSNG
jgi:hypothetical protein